AALVGATSPTTHGESVDRVAGRALAAEQAARVRAAVDAHGLPVAAFLDAIRTIAKRDATFARILRVFDEGHYTFSMDRSPDVRMKILESGGFKNLYEARSSAGVQDFRQRAFIEAAYLGQTPEAYAAMPDALKMKSLYLTPEPSAGIELVPTVYFDDLETKQNLGDTWVFDRAAIAPNTLFLAGDSYNRALLERDLVGDWKQFEIDPDAKLKGDHVGDFLLPLEWVATLVPYYFQQVEAENRWRFTNHEDPKIQARHAPDVVDGEEYPLADWQKTMIDLNTPDFDAAFFARFPELEPFASSMLMRTFGNYAEGDYFGELSTQQVKALIFRASPPSAAERAALEARGIELIDGRPERDRA
ncbi:hypothetical protein L6R52_22005, partial [Myxococcota bacterium]|nr:hypothetical protein [Myxococcota bacterium]